MTSTYNEAWIEFCGKLGLEFELVCTDEIDISIDLNEVFLFKYFGAENGMLLFPDNTIIFHSSAAIIEKGYGYSVISAPVSSSSYDIQGMIEVLNDWEWTGPDSQKPEWIN
ncbi:MAG: hypothetical protein MRY72_09485 [Aquisalinus sp.]|nr:hypothetical protein [Aquisalinus sp.]